MILLSVAISSICIGFLLGRSITIKNLKIFNKSKSLSYIRRGLYKSKYIKSSDGSDIEATFEIGELESTDDGLSKVIVLDLKTSVTCNSEMFRNLKSMVDNSWIETKDIKWKMK